MSRRPSPPTVLLPAVITVATVGVAAGAAYLARNRRGDVKNAVVNRVLEAPAGRSSYQELQTALERAAVALAARADRAADTPGNRDLLMHIIGIERWGQERLKVALGQKTYVEDTHHPYRPEGGRSLPDLREDLSRTRSGTVDLVRQLHRSPPEDALTVNHNALGPLTAKAWVRYLTQHADLESRKLRAQKPEQDEPGTATAETATAGPARPR